MTKTIVKSSIQKQFPEVYTKLFSEYELVLSGHFGFNRFPWWIGHVDSYVNIKQKIDSTCYIGIRKVAQKWISIENLLMYNGEWFIPYERELIDIHYQKWLDILSQHMGMDKKSHGYQISIVSESTRGEWLGFSGTMFSLMTTGIGMLVGKYKSDMLDDYETFEKSAHFHQIKTIAHECVWDTKHGNTGPSFYITMTQTSHPQVYLSEEHDIKKPEDIEFIKEYCHDIPEMLHITQPAFSTLPIRWVMIYTWQRANTGMVEKQKQFTKMKNKNYSEWFNQQNWNKIHSHLHEEFWTHGYHEIITNAINAMSAKTLYIFSHIYQYGPRNEYIHELINHFNTINSMYNDIEDDSSIIDDFFEACASMQVSTNMFGVFPVYTSKLGWNYIAIFEDDSDLQVLEDAIEKMKPKYPHIRIASKYNFDTPPSQWIVIEQNMLQLQTSENAENVYMMIDNHGEQKFCAYADIEPEKTTGLFLDAIKNKVYLNGKALTSKDIKSQTTTIEIFDLILQDTDHTIKNNELGPSTFSGQQNQMLGKIIYPLTKLVQKETDKDFPLECSGSLREFWIKLWKTSTPVVLIKKVA